MYLSSCLLRSSGLASVWLQCLKAGVCVSWCALVMSGLKRGISSQRRREVSQDDYKRMTVPPNEDEGVGVLLHSDTSRHHHLRAFGVQIQSLAECDDQSSHRSNARLCINSSGDDVNTRIRVEYPCRIPLACLANAAGVLPSARGGPCVFTRRWTRLRRSASVRVVPRPALVWEMLLSVVRAV